MNGDEKARCFWDKYFTNEGKCGKMDTEAKQRNEKEMDMNTKEITYMTQGKDLATLLTEAEADITAQRRAPKECPPIHSAAELAAVLSKAVETGAPKHLLSRGLGVLIYHANHNARGGMYGLVGAEIAAKVGYAQTEADAPLWTRDFGRVTEAIAALARTLDYDEELVLCYEARAQRARAWIKENS